MSNTDKYVYPGTDVLINKFGIRDHDELQKVEILSTAGNLAYLQLHPVKGKFPQSTGWRRSETNY